MEEYILSILRIFFFLDVSILISSTPNFLLLKFWQWDICIWIRQKSLLKASVFGVKKSVIWTTGAKSIIKNQRHVTNWCIYKLFWLPKFNTILLWSFLVVAFKKIKTCWSINTCPTRAWNHLFLVWTSTLTWFKALKSSLILFH
jgi:hypothetical protein